ncbi:MAG: VirB8/TrbF family protein [Pseudomonadota bacterium]
MTEQYFKDGATWDYEIYGRLQQSRKRAWIVATLAIATTVLSVSGLVLVLPLKEFAPFVITLDESTGRVERLQALEPGALSDNEAVTMANIVKFLVARETYDPTDLKANFEMVSLYSASDALADYRALYQRSNPKRPTETYGHDTTVSVTVKNVSFLNRQTASVRFSTATQTALRNATVNHWVGILKFRYVQTPKALQDRFINPLGFQVTHYRRDQEILSQQ